MERYQDGNFWRADEQHDDFTSNERIGDSANSRFASGADAPSFDAEAERLAGRRADEDELQTYRHTIELSSQIPWSSDPDGRTVSFTRKWTDLTGALALASPKDWAEVLHPDEVAAIAAAWDQARRTGERLDSEHRLRMRDGSYRWFRTRAAPRHGAGGDITRWYGITEDVHDRKLSELRYRWLAHHDPLTGLANRTLFQKKLGRAIERCRAEGGELALLVLDLDEFKQVNDQLGHDAGDRLLVGFAEAMKEILPDIARLGGDEFAVLLPVPHSRDAIWETIAAIQAKAKSASAGELEHGCAVSIGCAIFPVHGTAAGELLTSADIALYEAKDSPPQRARIFESVMRRSLQERASMLSVASYALRRDRIVPFYQPKVSLASARLQGFEALLRWNHPRLGHQPPATIAAAFEHHTLAPALGERMLGAVIADMRRWLDEGIEFGKIAVNVSSAELNGDHYAERLLERLAEAAIPTSRLEVEVTESVFLGRRGDIVEQVLRKLSEAGVTIALDDFGTGYASLSHLQRFPVDVLKTGRSSARWPTSGPTGRSSMPSSPLPEASTS
jgi:diguanylate cyclase (GGDEF)-like protein/PAS domain S-box-containing protein